MLDLFRETADLCRKGPLQAVLCTFPAETIDTDGVSPSATASPGKICSKEEGMGSGFSRAGRVPCLSAGRLPGWLYISKHLSILPLLEPHVLGVTPGLLRYAVNCVCAFPVISLPYRLKLLTRKKRVREGSVCSPDVRLQPLKEQASSGQALGDRERLGEHPKGPSCC